MNRAEENFPRLDSKYSKEISTELLRLCLELEEQQKIFSLWKRRLIEVTESALELKKYFLEREKKV